tara:strand:- start:284 stop:577 length:294 start_codon:yes stop_codon:yes gene_type:complete
VNPNLTTKQLTPRELETVIIDTISDWIMFEDCNLEWWACTYEAKFEKEKLSFNTLDVGHRDGDIRMSFNLNKLLYKAQRKQIKYMKERHDAYNRRLT